MKYDIEYFYNKFEKIPSYKWTTRAFFRDNGSKCALGHCGHTPKVFIGVSGISKGGSTEESRALMHIIRKVLFINDGIDYYKELGSTPKQRILNYLTFLAAKVKID